MSNRGLAKARKEFLNAARMLEAAQVSYDFTLMALKTKRKSLNKAKLAFQEAGTNLSVEEMD